MVGRFYGILTDMLAKKSNTSIFRSSAPCQFCLGQMEQRHILARFRFKGETIYIENVPAWVCNHCGEHYFDAPVYKQLEKIAQQRERIHKLISFPLAEFDIATMP
jgi:YgiT-type zinc finger domain-containing protein